MEVRIHLIVAGGGKVPPFRRRARRIGIEDRVVFAGHLPGVEDLLLGCDLLLQPTHYDPCSHATLEAWAAGLPVVSTRCNGAVELGEGTRAIRVVEDPGDVDGLARAMAECLGLEDRTGAARAVAEARSLDVHVREMEALLEEIRDG
jgi:UDP-glucose:(heptosyl)LPS alpha-1,3-glucosyltransferase